MPVALVVGCGECVWEDALRAYELFTPDAVVLVKDQITAWPIPGDHIGVTLHPDRAPAQLRTREVKKMGPIELWAHKPQGVVTKWTADWQGSSGLFGVKVAIEKGFAVVCAGVPMQDKFGHITRRIEWASCSMFLPGWKRHYAELQHTTRSMSGWTKEFLGEPTQEWLHKHGAKPSDHKLVAVLMEKINASTKSNSGSGSVRSIGLGAA